MRPFGALYDWVMRLSAHPRAPWYLGGLSFAESSFFPVPPDVMLAPMSVARPERHLQLALITTLASVVGGLVGYFIGLLALDAVLPLIERAGYLGHYEHARDWFARWGFWAVFLAGFSPIPFKVFTLSAGALAMPLLPFTVAAVVGRGARFFLVSTLMARLGPAMQPVVRRYVEWLGWAVVLLAVGAYLWLSH